MALFVYVLAGVLAIICLKRATAKKLSLDHIPTVGSPNGLLSYLTAFRYLVKANVVIQEGYSKYKGRIFKVPQMSDWLLIVTGDELVEELRSAPENVLSMEAAMADILQSDYTLGPTLKEDTYHIGVLRSAMNKNLANVLPDVVDELDIGFGDVFDAKLEPEGWTPLKVVDMALRLVVRSSNRAFVGLPTCRIDEFCAVNTQFAVNVMIGSFFINTFPEFLKPTVGSLFTSVSGHQRKVLKYLGPIIDERKAKLAEYGPDYPDKPNDFLSWLIDSAPRNHHFETENLALRMLIMNFVALHTTAMSFVHALYNLAAMPEYADPLREEIEAQLGSDMSKWTKDAFAKCWKLDSFLKESQRLNGLGALSLPRKALKTYTFRDGTVIPEGATLSATQTAVHYDSTYYENAGQFDGFRFYRQRVSAAGEREGEELAEENKEEDWRNRLTGTGVGYLAFGGGRHVCPGRFFAALELKTMLAIVLLRYDVKMAKEGVRPEDQWFGPACIPSNSAEVLFKRRTTFKV
ncbi:cytochrome P450 [Trametopsis cervina]|nr:cytochrome P450 [Trametopsis cervina]